MSKGKKPEIGTSSVMQEAFESALLEKGSEAQASNEIDAREKISSQLENLSNGDMDISSALKEITESPQDVFRPIWRKVNLLLSEIKLTEDEADRLIQDKYVHQIPQFDMTLEQKIELAKSFILLEEVLKAIPGSHYVVQKLKQSMISGESLEVGHKEKGVMMMADISGFTSLMEKGATRGKIGVSEVHKKINDVFRHLGKVVARHKGFVMKYGGDAMTIYFHGREAEERAQSCGVIMQKVMGMLYDPDDPESLKLSIGMASDEFYLGVIGDKERRELIIGGKGVDSMHETEYLAQPGEVLLSYPDGVKAYITEVPQIERGLDSDWGLHFEKLFVDKTYEAKIEDRSVKLFNRFLEENPINSVNDVIHTINRMSSTLLSFSPQGTSDQLFRPEAEPEWSSGNTAVFIKFEDIDYDSESINNDFTYVFRKIHRLVTEYKGRIDKFGPSLLIRFAPLGKAGGSARRAYECAHEILSVCTDYEHKMPIKVGIASGSMMLGQFGSRDKNLQYEYTVLGDPVNMAARLMARAETGEILVTPEVMEAVESRLMLIDERTGSFKGKSGELPYFSVGGWSRLYGLDIAGYLETAGAIYGRETELEFAQAIIQKTMQRNGQSILIETEAGMGKTKLLKHILKQCGVAGMSLYGANAEVHTTKQAFNMWKNVVGDIFHLDPRHDAEEQKKAAEKLLENINLSEDDVEILFTVLGLSDQNFTESAIRNSIANLLKEVSKSGAITIALEDLHWADVESLTTLDFLMRSLRNCPILFITTSRPEGVATQDYDQRFELDGLKPKDVESIAKDILTRDNTLLEPIASNKHFSRLLSNYICKVSGGNPLFVEETVFSLLRHGYLKYGQLIPVKNLPEHDIEITDDLQSLIEGRIKHLTYSGIFNEQVQDILHLITVVGSNPPPGFLDKLRKANNIDDEDFEKGLTRLIENRFVELIGGDLHFRHDLIRIAIAKMLSPKKLIKLHKQAIEFFEKTHWGDACKYIFHHTHEVLENYGAAGGHSYSELAERDQETLEFMEKMYENGIAAYKLLEGKPASQHAIIYYCEHVLGVADVLQKTIKEKRDLIINLTKQNIAIGGGNEIEKALNYYDKALSMSSKIPINPEEIFTRLDILNMKTDALIMLTNRDPAPLMETYVDQRALLRLLENMDVKDDSKLKMYRLLAERSLLFARVYEGYNFRSERTLNEALDIIKKSLDSTPENEIELKAWFLFLQSRAYQELQSHEQSYRSTSKVLELFEANPNKFTSTTLINGAYIINSHECFRWGQKIGDASIMQRGIKLSEDALKFFQKSGELKGQCIALERLTDYAQQTENWKDCIKWGKASYALAKDHNIPERLGYALANLAYAYSLSGQREEGVRYFQELEGLIPSLAEAHQKELVYIKENYLDKLYTH